MSGDLADLNFDARTETASSGFNPIPKGEYRVQVTKAQKKATKANDGHYLELTLQVVGGQYQNRILFAKFNLWNASADSVRIARGQYKDFCNAIGNPTPRDTSELVNKVLVVGVIVKNSEAFGLTNEVRTYKPQHSQSSQAMTQAPGQLTAQQPAQQPSVNPQLMTQPSCPTVPANPFG